MESNTGRRVASRDLSLCYTYKHMHIIFGLDAWFDPIYHKLL